MKNSLQWRERLIDIILQLDYPDTLPSLTPKDVYDLEITEKVEKRVKEFLDYIEKNIISNKSKREMKNE